MEITARFVNLEEMREFADFITAPNGPGQGSAQQMGAAPSGQTAAPVAQPAAAHSITPPAPAAQPPAQPVPAAPAAPTPVQPPAQQTPPVPAQQAQTAVPTTAPTYTLEDLGRAGVAAQEMGKDAEVRALVASFGVSTLQELPETQYGAFAMALRSMGAPI